MSSCQKYNYALYKEKKTNSLKKKKTRITHQTTNSFLNVQFLVKFCVKNQTKFVTFLFYNKDIKE